ncbi:MAG: hypothetical protein KY455_11310 [Euryarchaeota archaeon]|nr:hypothetical protein [Euryarchaeota archaeon]
MRRSLSAIEELHKEIEKQYKAGMNIIKGDNNSRRLFDNLVKECPNVPEHDIVRAFATPNIGTKNVEAATVAMIRRKEYNFRRENGVPMSYEE